jgi:hypothetical protein
MKDEFEESAITYYACTFLHYKGVNPPIFLPNYVSIKINLLITPFVFVKKLSISKAFWLAL